MVGKFDYCHVCGHDYVESGLTIMRDHKYCETCEAYYEKVRIYKLKEKKELDESEGEGK